MILLATYAPFLVSFLLGLFTLLLIFRRQPVPSFFALTLAGGLGLALSACLTFLSFIIYNRYIPGFVIGINLGFLGLLILTSLLVLRAQTAAVLGQMLFTWSKQDLLVMAALMVCSLPLWYMANFHAYGGWDAWSAWNLKAKFLFLAGEDWRAIFKPAMWRSSPHYPLLYPLMNVWGWSFLGTTDYHVCIFTSFLFSVLAVGLLSAAILKELGPGEAQDSKAGYIALLPVAALLTQPVFVKLSLSQYCDMVLGYFLLAACVCCINSRKRGCLSYAVLAGLFTGFMSFTKSEGQSAAAILLFLSLPYFLIKNPGAKKFKLLGVFWGATVLAMIPAIYFNLTYAPENQTFINGLTSPGKPSTFLRLKTILGFYLIELGGADLWNIYQLARTGKVGDLPSNWHALFLILFVGIILSGRRAVSRELYVIPGFLLLYGLAVTAYYYTNTYFAVDWWLQVSLHRILFALIPLVMYWTFSALWRER